MIIDCHNWKTKEDRAANRCRVFVNGVEILQVWYVDTDTGLVKTYDVLGDGRAHATREKLDPEVIANAREGEKEFWDMPQNGIMSKNVRGVVELRPFDLMEMDYGQ